MGDLRTLCPVVSKVKVLAVGEQGITVTSPAGDTIYTIVGSSKTFAMFKDMEGKDVYFAFAMSKEPFKLG